VTLLGPDGIPVNRTINADEIVPGLWVGGFPEPWATDEIKKLRIKHVVFCAREIQPDADSQYPGLNVVRAPFDDRLYMTPAEEEIALQAATFVAAAMIKGQSVLVTCAAGVNRSAFVAAVALRGVHGMCADKAINLLRKQRKPKVDCKVLSNTTFTKLLELVKVRGKWRGGEGAAFYVPATEI
jgi:protein-tyrosine phosphatase